MNKNILKSNPYYHWVHFYSSEIYKREVDGMIKLANKLYKTATDEQKESMLIIFEISTKLELNFWNDSYVQKTLL